MIGLIFAVSWGCTQWVLAVIVIVAVFTVMGSTLYFHHRKQTFPKQTISLLKWLIGVLIFLLGTATLNDSMLSSLLSSLKWW
jgi:hypothetical protein